MCRACSVLESEFLSYVLLQVRGIVQERAITEISQLVVSNNSSTVLVVFDHKEKVLPLRYRKGQIQYFGKRGFSLLGLMACFRSEKIFYVIVIRGYSTQDSLQIRVLRIVQDIMWNDFPLAFSIILQSDNAPSYSAADNIRFIYQLNKLRNNRANFVQWVNTEALKGKTQLDCHFNYVGKQFQKFVQARNDMITENDIFEALKFYGGIIGSTYILLDLSFLSKNTNTMNSSKFLHLSIKSMTFVGQWAKI